MMHLPTNSATCGTTAFPSALSRSNRAGTPLATRQNPVSAVSPNRHCTTAPASVQTHCRSLSALDTPPASPGVAVYRRNRSWKQTASAPSLPPTMNTRSRMCGASTAAAGIQSHPTSYPSEAKSRRTPPKSRPSSADSSPGTFSPSTHLGRTTSHTRHISSQSHRSSSRPLRLPA
jgi:hypothetical protein